MLTGWKCYLCSGVNSGKCCIRAALLLFSTAWFAESAILLDDKPLWDPENKTMKTSEQGPVFGLPAMEEEQTSIRRMCEI